MNKRIVGVPLLCIFLFASAARGLAEDIVTTKGKVFKNAEIIRVESDGVLIKHSGGTERVSLAELPPAIQKKYGLDPKDAELRRKAEEVDRLKAELDRAQSELKRLKQDNERLRTERAQMVPAPAPAKPSKPLVEVPPVKSDDVVDVRDLVLYYKADAAAADARFKKKTFRITGTVERFNPKMFLRKYDVILESPDKAIKVAGNFDYADNFNAVVTQKRGQNLVALVGRNGEMDLMKAGDVIILKGTCQGLSDSFVDFSGCVQVR